MSDEITLREQLAEVSHSIGLLQSKLGSLCLDDKSSTATERKDLTRVINIWRAVYGTLEKVSRGEPVLEPEAKRLESKIDVCRTFCESNAAAIRSLERSRGQLDAEADERLDSLEHSVTELQTAYYEALDAKEAKEAKGKKAKAKKGKAR